MSKRRFFLLIMMLTFLMPAMILYAAAPNPSPSNFIITLKTALPLALFILALLALRYDPGYALTLIAAGMVVALFLSAATVQVNNQSYFAIVTLNVNVQGPTSLYTGQTGSYVASWSPSMPASVTWSVYLNGTLISNSSGGGSFSYNFQKIGKYLIIASVINQQNLAAGSGAIVVTVSNPPSPLGWVSGAIVGAFDAITAPLISGLEGFVQMVIRVFGAPLELMFYSPTPNQAPIFSSVYKQIQNYSTGLAMFFLAASVAYNAFKGAYNDIVDLGADVLYKLSVWSLFWGLGSTIYTYAAYYINFIIYNVFGPWLSLATAEYTAGSALIVGLTGLFSTVPLGFGDPIDQLMGSITYLLIITLAVITIKTAIMLAIVSLIPLLASLWLFEWTQKIAAVVVDLLIGLMIAGLVAAAITAFLATLPLGAVFFIIDPIAIDGEFLFSIVLFTFGLKPGEHLLHSARSGHQRAQEKAQAEAQARARQAEIESRPRGSSTTYM